MAKRKKFSDVGRVVTVSEAAADGQQPRIIRGIGITADVVNGNGRRYPASVLRAAVENLKSHLHESAGQGRIMAPLQEAQLLGEPEHPSDKATKRPNYLETVVKWTSVEFDGVHVQLEGQLIETSKGRDILALLESGVFPGISQRAYGESVFKTENGQRIEEITALTITGYDLVMEPSDPFAGINMFESVEDKTVTPEELKALLAENKELLRGLLVEDLEQMSAQQASKLEAQMRAALGVGAEADLVQALREAGQARQTLAQQQQQQAIDAAIAEQTKGLPYGKELNARFVEAVRAAKPGTVQAVAALVESKKAEYDAMLADARLAAMGRVQILGTGFEAQSGEPEYARPATEFSESLIRAGVVEQRDLRKPRNINERVAAQVLARFDQVHGVHLRREARLFDEAETTADLNLPYSVARAVVAAVWPQLVSTSIFDFGVTEQAPTKIFYESYSAESGLSGTVTDEVVAADHGVWVQMNKAHLTPGSVVVTNSGATVTYVEGTDYVIDYLNGKFLALAAGSISDNQSLKVDYTYSALRDGENQAIQRAKMTLASKNLDIKADRLATQITNEAIVFSRSQIGWDATTRTLSGLIGEIRRKIDSGLMYLALAAALSQASNSGGTWTASTDSKDLFAQYVGVARVKIAKRFYQPTGLLLSATNSDLISNWAGFSAAGARADSQLLPNGYIGTLKGLPVFHSTEFSDGYGVVVNREVVMHRVYSPMAIKGPYASYSNGNLVAADQWYAEEYNGSDAPVPEKASYVKIA